MTNPETFANMKVRMPVSMRPEKLPGPVFFALMSEAVFKHSRRRTKPAATASSDSTSINSQSLNTAMSKVMREFDTAVRMAVAEVVFEMVNGVPGSARLTKEMMESKAT